MNSIKENIVFVHASPEDATMFHCYQELLHGENDIYFRNAEECKELGVKQVKGFILDSLKSVTSALFILKDMNSRDILAHVHIQVGQTAKNRHKAEIYLGVLKQYQDIGVGSKLMEIVDFWARKENIERLQLSVFATNEKAIRFYKRLGFVEEGRLTKAVKISKNKYTDEIIMAKFVEPLHLEKKD